MSFLEIISWGCLVIFVIAFVAFLLQTLNNDEDLL